MAVNLSFIGGAGWQFFDDNGDPLAGGKIYTYAAGTTTPLTTYTARDGITPNANPIILDAAGRTPQQIWSTEGLLYKYVLTTSTDVLVRSYDNIGGSVVASDLGQDLAAANGSSLVGLTGFKGQVGTVQDIAGNSGSDYLGFLQSGTSAVARSVQDKLRNVVYIDDFAPVGDGVADDRAAIQAAYDATPVNGTLVFPQAKTYRINSKLIFNKSVSVDFGGSTLKLNQSVFPNNRTLDIFPGMAATVTWTEAVALGANTFNVVNTLTAGDYIVLRLGTDPHDPAEDHYVRVCKVLSSNGISFTVDVHVPYAINNTNNKFEKITSLVANVTFKNLVIDYFDGTTPDTHINAYNIFNVSFENIRAIKSRILINVYESHNLIVRNVDATVVRLGVSSHGRVFTCWQVENTIVENVAAYGADNEQMVFVENWSRSVKFKNIQLYSTNGAQTQPLYWVSGGSYDIEFDEALFSPSSTVDVLNTGGTPATYAFKNLRMIRRPQFLDMRSVESFADVVAGVNFMRPLGIVQNRGEGTITTSGAKYIDIANGVMRRLWVYVQSVTDLTAYVEWNIGSGSVVAITSQLAANQWKEVTPGYDYGTLFGANNPAYPRKRLQLIAGAGFPATQKFAFVVEYWPIDGSEYTFATTSTGL